MRTAELGLTVEVDQVSPRLATWLQQLAVRLESRGLASTKRWVSDVGKALGRSETADAVIQRELDRVVPALQWVVPQALLGRRVVFLGDPLYAPALVSLLAEVGAEVVTLWLWGQAEHLSEPERQALAADGRDVAFAPTSEQLLARWAERRSQGVDLVVSNTLGLERLQSACAWLEWGFPSHHTHFLRDRPFLGFDGALAFLERAVTALSRPTYTEGRP